MPDERFFQGDPNSPFPLVAVVDDGEMVWLYALSQLPPLQLAQAGQGSGYPRHLGRQPLTTLINHNVGIFGRCLAWSERECTLEVRACKESVGLALDPDNEDHSDLVMVDRMVAISREQFVHACRTALGQAYQTARREADDSLDHEMYLATAEVGGLSADPFFARFFSTTPAEFYAALGD